LTAQLLKTRTPSLARIVSLEEKIRIRTEILRDLEQHDRLGPLLKWVPHLKFPKVLDNESKTVISEITTTKNTFVASVVTSIIAHEHGILINLSTSRTRLFRTSVSQML
jgi:dihydropteroate synthase